MRGLLDVNVLIALLGTDHTLHSRATKWLGGQARAGWASCPITQNGCVHIMSHVGYPIPFQCVQSSNDFGKRAQTAFTSSGRTT